MDHGIFRRIFTLAHQLESDRKVIWDWLHHTHIGTLGGHTAMELVFTDQGEQVIALLQAALRSEEPRKLPGQSRSLSHLF
jgi:hypothetical protein